MVATIPIRCEGAGCGVGSEVAAYPVDWVRERKFWPPVSRIDNYRGGR